MFKCDNFFSGVVMLPGNLERVELGNWRMNNHGLKRQVSREALPKLENYNTDQSNGFKAAGLARPTLEQLYLEESVPSSEVGYYRHNFTINLF